MIWHCLLPQDVASRGGEFVIHGVRVAGKYERGSFTMRFRCVSMARHCLADVFCSWSGQESLQSERKHWSCQGRMLSR